jgi:CDP-diacylglycerol--glycerol-3-phosphate 3-phosphatidyltransferase
MPVECRPGTAAVAALVIGATIVLALRGVARTEVEPTGERDPGAPLIGPRVRAWYRGLHDPLEAQLAGWGVRPDHLTYAQLAVSVLAGLAFARGCIFLAGWLTICAGTLDILDGGLARRTGLASPRGAFVDSVVDRCAEATAFVGLGVFFRHSAMMLFVVVLAAFSSQMVSYVRARAEGLGLELRTGSMQRPERYVILGFGAWISGLLAHLACPLLGRQTHVILAAAVAVLALAATWTAVERAREATAALRGREVG